MQGQYYNSTNNFDFHQKKILNHSLYVVNFRDICERSNGEEMYSKLISSFFYILLSKVVSRVRAREEILNVQHALIVKISVKIDHPKSKHKARYCSSFSRFQVSYDKFLALVNVDFLIA